MGEIAGFVALRPGLDTRLGGRIGCQWIAGRAAPGRQSCRLGQKADVRSKRLRIAGYHHRDE